ncbi:Citrate (pro-3S)-lyase [Agrilactobacillus composti DSM 18527 = JCM 14202]|uniref:Citrate (Pro-3S)-lyase n=1 Tax=Agrilactobacillus composti DSM 18527 = JCM 14202 TaxID=1423734 RepID=A0A0R1XKB1_9LACO|nr:aldolase/citrate lyase family protein [Agrilactobacillus composti]KRM30606.1 Citrate (pro-3S)-lyase [Agrilactobacillus composti DSM 18527 = JCM 14202]
MTPERLRRTMIFLNTQRAALVKDAFVYQPDCVIFDLEDAVAQREKDAARIQLYHTLKDLDYQGIERWVRINALDSDLFQEDIRAAVAGGAEGIRLPKTETAEDVQMVADLVDQAEVAFNRPVGTTMVMAALESPLAILNAYEIATSSPRLMGIALSAGDYTRTMHAKRTVKGLELFGARSQLLLAARAAGVMAFDTVYTDTDDPQGFIDEVKMIRDLGFDGKSCISPKQIGITHDIFTPDPKEVLHAQHVIQAVQANEAKGVGVLTVDGKMVDIAWVEGAKRTLKLAKAAGSYRGDLV